MDADRRPFLRPSPILGPTRHAFGERSEYFVAPFWTSKEEEEEEEEELFSMCSKSALKLHAMIEQAERQSAPIGRPPLGKSVRETYSLEL